MLVIAPAAATAAEVDRLTVEREGDLFHLYLSARIRASTGAAWAALTRYPCLHRLSEAVRASEVLGLDQDDRPLVYTASHLCVWIFCRDLEQVQRMRTPGPLRLEAETLAGLSDFEQGSMRWTLAPEVGGTRFELRAELRPAFWVPPLLGPLLIMRGLRGYALDALSGLEREAAGP